jgi:hypothetical protein
MRKGSNKYHILNSNKMFGLIIILYHQLIKAYKPCKLYFKPILYRPLRAVTLKLLLCQYLKHWQKSRGIFTFFFYQKCIKITIKGVWIVSIAHISHLNSQSNIIFFFFFIFLEFMKSQIGIKKLLQKCWEGHKTTLFMALRLWVYSW